MALYPLPAKEKHAVLAEMSQGEYDLLAVILKAVHSLLRAVRQHERRTLHDWLAATRSAAGIVGERAVRRAAAERAHEDRLSKERKMLLGAAPAPPACMLAHTHAACGHGERCLHGGSVRRGASRSPRSIAVIFFVQTSILLACRHAYALHNDYVRSLHMQSLYPPEAAF